MKIFVYSTRERPDGHFSSFPSFFDRFGGNMLTDTALKALKPREKKYKVTDRDGMYVLVMPTGAISFRYDYRLNGRRETVILGRYGPAGLSLARAREKLIDAKRAVQEGRSPAREKQQQKRRLKEARSFGEFGERYFQEAPMADSTRAMRRTIMSATSCPNSARGCSPRSSPMTSGRYAPR
jgi:hypothetical protein